MPKPQKRLLAVIEPPKPISQMTEEELDAFAELIASRADAALCTTADRIPDDD